MGANCVFYIKGNVLFANELARRYGDQGIVSTALNPGNIKTELQRNLGRVEGFFVVRPYKYTVLS